MLSVNKSALPPDKELNITKKKKPLQTKPIAIEQHKKQGCRSSIFNTFIRSIIPIKKASTYERSYDEYLSPSRNNFTDWSDFFSEIKEDPFYVNRCLTKMWEHNNNFSFPPYQRVVDSVILELCTMKQLSNKPNSLITKSLEHLTHIQQEGLFGFQDVNTVISELLSLDDQTNTHNFASMTVSENKPYIEGLYHFRVFCVDELTFSDLDNPGFVSLIGVSFNSFEYDYKNNKTHPTWYETDGTSKKTLNFATDFARHDLAHSYIIEGNIKKVLGKSNLPLLEIVINNFIESKKNYQKITSHIKELKDGPRKRALELIKFNIGHEEVNSPTFWSKKALEICCNIAHRNTATMISDISKRVEDKFAYPKEYKQSGDNDIVAHLRPALDEIFDIVEIKNIKKHDKRTDLYFGT